MKIFYLNKIKNFDNIIIELFNEKIIYLYVTLIFLYYIFYGLMVLNFLLN